MLYSTKILIRLWVQVFLNMILAKVWSNSDRQFCLICSCSPSDLRNSRGRSSWNGTHRGFLLLHHVRTAVPLLRPRCSVCCNGYSRGDVEWSSSRGRACLTYSHPAPKHSTSTLNFLTGLSKAELTYRHLMVKLFPQWSWKLEGGRKVCYYSTHIGMRSQTEGCILATPWEISWTNLLNVTIWNKKLLIWWSFHGPQNGSPQRFNYDLTSDHITLVHKVLVSYCYVVIMKCNIIACVDLIPQLPSL